MPINRRNLLKSMGQAGMYGMGACAIASGPAASGSPIKIGQIGIGHAHATKLSVYRDSPDYEVVGLVESDSVLWEKSKSVPAYRDLPLMTQEQLLNVPGLQAVLVETKVENLLDTAEICVKAGKHIHLDKPAGNSLPQFQRILEIASQQKLLVQMGYMYRYNPAIVLLREALKEGWLGEVFEVHAVMSKIVPPEDRKRLAAFRGGMMFELGCHVLDLVVSILGEPQQVSAHFQHVSPIPDQLADNAMAVLTYPGALASIKSSALEFDGSARRHLVVCGTEGTMHIQPLDNPAARLTLSKAHAPYKKGINELTFPKYVRYVDDAADMAQILRGEKASDFPYEHDLAVQRTLLKACEAAG